MAGGRTKPQDGIVEKGMRTAQRNIENNELKIKSLEEKVQPIELSIVNKLEWVNVPAVTGSPGKAGQLAYASGFLYICVATSTWKRVAVSTW
tara:strand:+ start:166 stop:441 length:276 start_codon:yes stop_codon:yes gene_type:complete